MSPAADVLLPPKGAKREDLKVLKRGDRLTELDTSVEELKLDGVRVRAEVSEAIVDGELTFTCTGASSLFLVIHDEGRKLRKSGIWAKAVQLELSPRSKWRLVAISKGGDDYTVTFIPEAVWQLMQKDKPKKAYRDQVTRAEFGLALVREIKKPKIKYVSPDLHKEQPIKGEGKGKARREADKDKKDAGRKKGVPNSKKLMIRDHQGNVVPMNNVQKHNASVVLDQCMEDGAPEAAQVAVIAATINETLIQNITDQAVTDLDSIGILQLRIGFHGLANARSISKSTHLFLTKKGGFTGASPGNAIDMARRGSAPAVIAGSVMNNIGTYMYGPYVPYAQKIVAAYHGGSIESGSGGGGERKRYAFRRGDAGSRENSWDCLGRMAEEVRWRRFEFLNTIYFLSDGQLMRSTPRAVISEDAPGVNWIDWEWNTGKRVATCVVNCRIERWEVPPGAIVEIEDEGEPIDGRWLVGEVQRNLFRREATITLRRRQPVLPEPLAELKNESGGSRHPNDDTGGGDGGVYDLVYDEAVRISNMNIPYLYGGGHGGEGATSRGIDCSGYVGLCLLAAKIGNVAHSSQYMSWGEPGPGKHFTVCSNEGHVFMEFYGREHKRADTGGGPPSGPHVRSTHRDHSGFTERHWPGH